MQNQAYQQMYSIGKVTTDPININISNNQ